ncbi:MAG: hypothetical protein IKK43_01835 [Clostridia bacterium]|nr:hypothetical protein [Clostridia bacterium]
MEIREILYIIATKQYYNLEEFCDYYGNREKVEKLLKEGYIEEASNLRTTLKGNDFLKNNED